ARIELAPAGEILVRGGSIALGLGDERQVAEAHALAVAGTVDDKASDAARSEVGDTVAVLQLLGDVEAVEEHHARRRFRSDSVGLGMHEQRRQAGAVVGHLDWLDAWMAAEGRGVPDGVYRRGVDGNAALRARMDETLAGLVIACRAHEAGCRGEPMPFALLVAAACRDLVAHAGPLFEPGRVIAEVIFERAS